jgi:hypothetical protein
MKLGELLDQLTALDPETDVAITTECHGCFSDRLTVESDSDGILIKGASR